MKWDYKGKTEAVKGYFKKEKRFYIQGKSHTFLIFTLSIPHERTIIPMKNKRMFRERQRWIMDTILISEGYSQEIGEAFSCSDSATKVKNIGKILGGCGV